jgi:hypothetical protein
MGSATSKTLKGSREVKPGEAQIIVSRWRIDSVIPGNMFLRISAIVIGAGLPGP